MRKNSHLDENLWNKRIHKHIPIKIFRPEIDFKQIRSLTTDLKTQA